LPQSLLGGVIVYALGQWSTLGLHLGDGQMENIGNYTEMTVQEFAKKIIRITGARSKIIYKTLPRTTPNSGVRTSRGREKFCVRNRRSGWPKAWNQLSLICRGRV
jgi:hypothetical protein